MSRIAAALLALVFSQVASSATVTFNFTAIVGDRWYSENSGPLVVDLSIYGTPVSGYLTFSTEGVEPEAGNDTTHAAFVMSEGGVSGAVLIGDKAFTLPDYVYQSGSLDAWDSDSVSVVVRTDNYRPTYDPLNPNPSWVPRHFSRMGISWSSAGENLFSLTGQETVEDLALSTIGRYVIGEFQTYDQTCRASSFDCVTNSFDAYQFYNVSLTRSVAPVPLPGALLFLASGCGMLGFARRRKAP